MKRFFSEQLSKDSEKLTISGDEFHHLKNVLRLKAGQRIEIINGAGLLATALIDKVDRHSARVIIEESARVETYKESPVKITLIQGLLKGTNVEVVTTATVLGAVELRFFTSEYTAAKSSKGKEGHREKWRKTAIEAAKQCGRTVLPDIKEPLALSDALEDLSGAFKIALYEGETESGLKEYLKKYAPTQSVAVIVGPEGGFSASDLETIRSAGFHTVRMGQRRLRSEAAAHSILSIIDFELGGLGSG